MRILIFGTGDYYQRYKKWFEKYEVAALLDNSPSKQKTKIDGITVLPPEEGVRLAYDRIVILSFYVKAMKKQLLELGVPEEKILHFYELHNIIDVSRYPSMLQCYGRAEELLDARANRRKILLLSQDLTLGGPALALFHAAEALVKHGYDVVYASMLDGPLREVLMAAGVPVVVDAKLQIAPMEKLEWTEHFSLVVCNTINYHVFLLKRNGSIPVIWWLHDAEFFYDGIRLEVLQKLNKQNLNVYAVGPVPKQAFQRRVPDMAIGNLLYGVTDAEKNKEKASGDKKKICFVVIGYIEERKGQDILIQAIRLLPDELRKQTEFYLVGQNSSIMAQQICTEIRQMPEVTMTGVVDRKRINEILSRADCLICPSREDPMPTVAAEAMMHSVPCIISDAVGTAEYIETGINGLVFANEDVKELSEQIAWCAEHPAEIEKMGIHARKVFEQYFSMEVFECDFLKIVRNALAGS